MDTSVEKRDKKIGLSFREKFAFARLFFGYITTFALIIYASFNSYYDKFFLVITVPLVCLTYFFMSRVVESFMTIVRFKKSDSGELLVNRGTYRYLFFFAALPAVASVSSLFESDITGVISGLFIIYSWGLLPVYVFIAPNDYISYVPFSETEDKPT